MQFLFRRITYPAGLLAALLLLAGCSGGQAAQPTPTAGAAPTTAPTVTQTPLPSATFTSTATATPDPTATPTRTATITTTSTITLTPTITFTPTVTLTPTPDYPDVTVKMQANCRYGPGTAYLYRWGLYPGDQAEVHGRNWDGSWLWVFPETMEPGKHCWASKIVFEETVDPAAVPFVQIPLPKTTFAGPPGNVRAVRDGRNVIVTWDPVPLSDDKRRGYLIEGYMCESQLYYPVIVHTDDTTYTFRDDQDCEQKPTALLYTAEKHGYSDPVPIPWP